MTVKSVCPRLSPDTAAAAAKSLSVVSDSVRPHGRQPTRLPRPWDSPGKNTGVGCHFLLPDTTLGQVTISFFLDETAALG